MVRNKSSCIAGIIQVNSDYFVILFNELQHYIHIYMARASKQVKKRNFDTERCLNKAAVSRSNGKLNPSKWTKN